jgi:hypothetical protein
MQWHYHLKPLGRVVSRYLLEANLDRLTWVGGMNQKNEIESAKRFFFK